MSFEPGWSSKELATALCDSLVKKGQLKEKPAFIRTDREAKICSVFEAAGLDGAKMSSFDNPGPLEMLVRKNTSGEPWVNQVTAALVAFLPEDVQHADKKMSMDEETKAQLVAAKEKTQHRRERLEEQKAEEEKQKDEKGEKSEKGDKGDKGGRGEGRGEGRGKGGGEREGGRGGRRGGERREWDLDDDDRRLPPGPRREREGGERFDKASMEKGGGKGKNRREMICVNCKKPGHKSRDCPEPPDENLVAERLAARAAKAETMRREQDSGDI